MDESSLRLFFFLGGGGEREFCFVLKSAVKGGEKNSEKRWYESWYSDVTLLQDFPVIYPQKWECIICKECVICSVTVCRCFSLAVNF